MGRKKIYEDLPDRSHPDYMRLYAEKNKEKLKERSKQYRLDCVEKNPNHYKDHYTKYKEVYKSWREENRDVVSEKQWKNRGIVDITYGKFLKELEKQNSKCAICAKDLTKPQVDHDHITGKYRGILCIPCNNGLGVYELYKDRFEKYLKES